MTAPFVWQTRIDAAIAAAQAEREIPRGHRKLHVQFRTPAGELIRAAALARGVTVTGFTRRSTLAMTAHVLGLEYLDVIAADPTIHVAGESSPAPDPVGRVGGPWEIALLR